MIQKQIEIIYEDDSILVCRKPSGMPVQTAKFGQQDMVSVLKNYRALNKENPEIYVVHRLDQPVEGVMVFAKNNHSASILCKQIQQKSVDKFYRAVAEGVFDISEGVLEDYLLKDARTNTSAVVAKNTKEAKLARLKYRVLEEKEQQSLLEIQLETGRHHQIRVQMAHAGHPLVGDKKYNPACSTGYLPVGLCSVRIGFVHPISKKEMEFSIEPKGAAFW